MAEAELTLNNITECLEIAVKEVFPDDTKFYIVKKIEPKVNMPGVRDYVIELYHKEKEKMLMLRTSKCFTASSFGFVPEDENKLWIEVKKQFMIDLFKFIRKS